MIEKIEDFYEAFADIDSKESADEVVEKVTKEKLGLSFSDLKEALSKATIENAEELTHEFVNVAPYGDYSKLLEDNDGMTAFFKTEAHKAENWKLVSVKSVENKKLPNMLNFVFSNTSVDDGETMSGFVYVSFEGKIKHAFAQGES